MQSRLEKLIQQISDERAARLKAEQRLAGTKSAVQRLQALVLEQRAQLARLSLKDDLGVSGARDLS